MKIAQVSLLVFISKITASIFGFVATIYFARVLGAEVLGVYSIITALVSWLVLGGRAGVQSAIIKRISEGEERGAYLASGMLLMLSLTIILIITIVFFRSYVEGYVSGFQEYSSISVVWFLVSILLAYMGYTLVSAVLQGQNLVHIAGVLNPLNLAAQSVFQIVLVFLGWNLVGMVAGYAAGLVVVTAAGLLFISIKPRKPNRAHFKSIFDYAKFSWIGNLKSRAFNDVDILILGAMVSQTLVGVYAVAWSLTKFLELFGAAVSQTIFPEISNVSAQESLESARPLIEDAIAYSGLIVIPGLIGGTLLSDRLLQLYSPEFVQGTEVLWLLLLSILFYTYLQQHLSILNAINRPDLSFRVNAVFIACNILLNGVLIWEMGWIGAAIASAISAGVGLLLSHYFLKSIIAIAVPLNEISRQAISATVMGGVVWSLREIIETTDVVQNNVLIVITIVTVGAAVYFAVLASISPRFRTTLARNAPFNIPYPE